MIHTQTKYSQYSLDLFFSSWEVIEFRFACFCCKPSKEPFHRHVEKQSFCTNRLREENKNVVQLQRESNSSKENKSHSKCYETYFSVNVAVLSSNNSATHRIDLKGERKAKHQLSGASESF